MGNLIGQPIVCCCVLNTEREKDRALIIGDEPKR